MVKEYLKAIWKTVFWSVILYINGAWALYFLGVIEKKDVINWVGWPIGWCFGLLCYPFVLWKETIASHHWAAPGAEWEVIVGVLVMGGAILLRGVFWAVAGYSGIRVAKAVKRIADD